jgi:hypothetical protein
MNDEKILTPQESINLIAETIAKTKENISENSFAFLLWGWLISIASFLDFFLRQYTSFKYYFLPFPILGIIGIIGTILFYVKRKSVATQTYIDYFLSRMWAVLGISFILVVVMNVSRGMVPFTYTLLIAGIGTLVSGWVMKFQPLILGGILFLISMIASVYLTDEYKVLLHGFAIVAGYLIPGYLLKKTNQ